MPGAAHRIDATPAPATEPGPDCLKDEAPDQARGVGVSVWTRHAHYLWVCPRQHPRDGQTAGWMMHQSVQGAVGWA